MWRACTWRLPKCVAGWSCLQAVNISQVYTLARRFVRAIEVSHNSLLKMSVERKKRPRKAEFFFFFFFVNSNTVRTRIYIA